jgi:hypothetical protein
VAAAESMNFRTDSIIVFGENGLKVAWVFSHVIRVARPARSRAGDEPLPYLEGMSMHVSKRRIWSMPRLATFVVAAVAGASASVALAQGTSEFCPGENYCYTASGCTACKTLRCDWLADNCPDPGTTGSNCYVCSTAK